MAENIKNRVGHITLQGSVGVGREQRRGKLGPQALLEQFFTGSEQNIATELNEMPAEIYLGHQLI